MLAHCGYEIAAGKPATLKPPEEYVCMIPLRITLKPLNPARIA